MASQKVYASENDVPTYKPNTIQSRNPKNDVASPGRRPDGGSPSFPSNALPVNIFAGSTFHASPAPSALPLPSFLGLSNEDSPATKDMTPESAHDTTPPTSESDEGSPIDELPCRHSDSPLEFFFRADRAEKAERARVRRASSANTDTGGLTFNTLMQDSPRKECNTLPKTIAHNSFRRSGIAERDSTTGIPPSELDGNTRLPVGPAFSTPYSERIRAARSSSAQTTPSSYRNVDSASSEALKRYLWTGQLTQPELQGRPASSSPSVGSSQSQSTNHTIQQPIQPHYRPTGHQHQGTYPSPDRFFPSHQNLSRETSISYAPRAQSPSTTRVHAESSPHSDHVLALEGSLRRMLKLDALG
ncbi:hypothetical protein NPX13_g5316 [Xylaria arbuscula]|uniref:Uncharacterized protein n=1 Tax=Xylaria arbuscula TaxID=114810 RepID=A0A9W8NDW2_9PEZI|nr:hypothetical protein NPX13_g5316 [Xylaria arbuscula]